MVRRIFFYFSNLGTEKNNINQRKWAHVSLSNEISVRTFSGHLEHNTQEYKEKNAKKVDVPIFMTVPYLVQWLLCKHNE